MGGGYSGDSAAAAAFFLIFALVWLVLALGAYVLTSIFLMKLFEKAGVEGKWRAWVPIYNTLVFVKLGDLNPWWLLIGWLAGIVLTPVFIGYFVILAVAVYLVLAAYRIGLKLQKDPVWVVLYIFLSIVWLGILAFDKSRWNPNVPRAPWADSFLKDTTVWQGIPVQPAGLPAAGGYGQPGAPGAYPPAGYQPPPQGYQPPPPQAYQPPPPGYQPPPPAGYEPPPAQPPASTDPPPADPNAPRP